MSKVLLIISVHLLVLASCSHRSTKPAVTEPAETSSYLQTTDVKLSNTQVHVDSTFFQTAAVVVLAHSIDDGSISYHIDGGNSNTFTTPLTVSQSCTIDSYVTKTGYISSDTVRTHLVKVNDLLHTAQVTFLTPPHENYPGQGATSMTDHKKGSLAFRSSDSWCGFTDSVVIIDIVLDESITADAVTVSMLADHGAWIFGPRSIKILADGLSPYSHTCAVPQAADSPHYDIVRVPLPAIELKQLRIEISQLPELPMWHAGAGSSPWLFIDEIIIE